MEDKGLFNFPGKCLFSEQAAFPSVHTALRGVFLFIIMDPLFYEVVGFSLRLSLCSNVSREFVNFPSNWNIS